MAITFEGARDLAHILSEGNGSISRGTVTILSGQGILAPGTVLGKVTASGKFVVSPDASTVGIEGAEVATCVLAYGVDATSADAEALVTERMAEMKGAQLTYDSLVDDATKKTAKATQLAANNIIVR